MKIEERIIKDWSDYIEIVSQKPYKRFIYRGQADKKWPIETTIRRQLKNLKVRKDFYNSREQSNIDIFKSRAHLYLNHLPSKTESYKNTLEWLALMQHFGAPTRLLDWTYSPFVAAFFALETIPSDGCVYEIDYRALRKANIGNFGKNYEKHVFSKDFEYYFIFPYEPKLQNERLVAQQGLFIVPNDIDIDVEEIIEEYSKEKSKILTKYIFSMTFSETKETIKKLKQMNIDNLRLFPGIEGLSRSLTLQMLEAKSVISS